MAEFIVTLVPGTNLRALANKLAGHGFAVEQELEALDMLTGQADPASLAAIRALEGVAAVEESGPVHIAEGGHSSESA